MFSSNLLRRPRFSTDPRRRLIIILGIQQGYSEPIRHHNNSAIRGFHVDSIRQKPALNQVLRQAGANPNPASGEIPPSSKGKSLDLSNSLGGTKSNTQEVLDGANTSKVTQTMDKAKLERLRKHIKRFFAKYPKFNYGPTKHYSEEFIRMTTMFGWTKNSQEYGDARRRLNTATVLQFNENFGSVPETGESESDGKRGKSKSEDREESENKGKPLRKWIKLFNRIDLKDPVMPKTVRKFEERVKSVHTNICDVLYTDIAGGKATD
ncbi:unnamed protein product [Rhizoctonia solani]|uniref:Uncharacterized protein n=1 Tax=Rhizoctonia solani TaxID=456999 RepID=A0A8H3AZY0_9AGAM|nr:unnamed protein product [Rhizoctonia solani]